MYKRQLEEDSCIDVGNARFGGQEALVAVSYTHLADSALGNCLERILEVKYLAHEVNWTFNPLWRGDGNETRKGQEFIHRMEIASGLIIQCNNGALEALEAAQDALGLNGTKETAAKPTSAA